MAENHTQADSIGLQLQVECWYEQEELWRSMIQLPLPSTPEAQPRNVTFLTMKTVVRKIQKNRRSDGLMCLDKAVLGQRGGGGYKQFWALTARPAAVSEDLPVVLTRAKRELVGVVQDMGMPMTCWHGW